jgi:ATP-dependent DNA helicase RecQ
VNLAWRWTAANERKAQRRLGIRAYRPGQRELIHAVMAGRSALGVLPTGGKYPRAEQSLKLYCALRARHADAGRAGATVAALIEATDLPKTRVKVLIADLEAMGIVRRRRPTLELTRQFRTDEELTAFVKSYDRRHEEDRARLDAIMRYGTTTECRIRYLTRYFGDERKDDCGRCDNCRSGATKQRIDTRRLKTVRGALTT